MAQIAQMFTTLGFKVDDAGLKELETKLSQIRATTAQFATSLGEVADKLGVVKRKVSELNKVLNKDSKSSTSKGATQYYSKLSSYIERVDKAHDSLVLKAPNITSAMNKIRGSVNKTANAWERYGVAIKEAKKHMNGISPKSGAQGAGNVKTTINNITNNYNGGSRGAGGGSGTPRPNPNQPTGDSGNTIVPLGGVRDFFRSMTPATMLAGGAVSAGYVMKEVVDAGREVQKMQTVMLMASNGQRAQLEHNLEFVKSVSNEIGISYNEFGNAYAKMLSATKDTKGLGLEQKEKMFKDLSTYMVTIGTSADDQKGVFRALTQMFTKGKVQAEEMLQMAERGVPAYAEIKKAYMSMGRTAEQFEKDQIKGLLKPHEILPIMAKNLSHLATSTGAYDQALRSSQASQQRFVDQLKLASHAIMQGGLDKALATMFDGLTEIVKVLVPVIQGIGIAIKSVYDLVSAIITWYGENPKLGATIVSLTALMVIWTASGATATGTAIAMTFALGNLARQFLLLAKRIVPAIALLIAFRDIAKYHKDGEYNWVSVLSAEFGVLYARINLAYQTLRVFFATLKVAPTQAFGVFFENHDKNSTTPKSFGEKAVEWYKNTTPFGGMQKLGGTIIDKLTSSSQAPTNVSRGTSSYLAVDIKQNGQTVATENFNLGNSAHRSLILQEGR